MLTNSTVDASSETIESLDALAGITGVRNLPLTVRSRQEEGLCDPNYVMSTEMPTGRKTGHGKHPSQELKVASELAMDGAPTSFPNDEEGLNPLELTFRVCCEQRWISDFLRIQAPGFSRP